MSEFKFTDAEWRTYQQMPDQGYSHRGHLEYVFNRWFAEQERQISERVWEEGYAAGDADAHTENRLDTPNPYTENK